MCKNHHGTAGNCSDEMKDFIFPDLAADKRDVISKSPDFRSYFVRKRHRDTNRPILLKGLAQTDPPV